MPVLYLAAFYLVAGIIFSIIFLLHWIKIVDPATTGSSWGFKLIIAPGCIVLWPILLVKLLKRYKENNV